MEVNQFLSSLKNLEKTRNFNVFKNYSLEAFQSVLESLCLTKSPDETLRISVVGTNGKGSISHYLSEIGFRSKVFSTVGLYTSPHLLIQNERIRLNGSPISDEWMNQKLNSFSARELERLRTLSYFEFFTFIAILYFRDNACKLEVYEAGLGGRLDATKLTYPDYIVLAKIGLDHTEILGDTEERILLEKLQIAGENIKRIYTFQQDVNLRQITQSFCKERKIDLIEYPHSMEKDYLSFNKEYALFIMNDILKEKKLPTLDNRIFDLIPNIAGRMQVLRTSPILVFDIGHNPSAIHFLLQSLQATYPNEIQWEVYFGCLKDKDVKKILELLTDHPIVLKVIQIVGENWNQDTISHQKIEHTSEEQFLHLLANSKKTSLVLGSFRLYPLVKL